MPDFTQIKAGEKKEVVEDEKLTEMEIQTEYLQKINSKLGFMQGVLILFLILSFIGWILR